MAADDMALVQSRQKQQRTTGGALITSGGGGGAVVAAGPQRTSEQLAPIMLLSGHGAAVHTSKFSPDGLHLLSEQPEKCNECRWKCRRSPADRSDEKSPPRPAPTQA